MDYERLDRLAERAAKGDFDGISVLSTGERLYVALAANSIEMLDKSGDTIAEALARLGEEGVSHLIERWRYRGNPRYFA